jgi:hypothetical protein
LKATGTSVFWSIFRENLVLYAVIPALLIPVKGEQPVVFQEEVE